jgi:hypothetical protein
MPDAASMLRELSEPWSSGEGVKVAIDRAAKMAGLSYWRAFDIWYRKARRIDHHETTAIADALQKKNAKDARNELSELRLRLNRLEAILSQTDPEFHRTTIDLVGSQVRRSR